MGAVYRALDESLQRFVAVKVIRTDDSGSTKGRQVSRLLDEAVAQARLNHPNVVTIYYVGREGEEPFLAMELLPGPTLAQKIAEQPLPYEDVIHYALQVCSALKQASQLGLVHGDLKPSNLILADEKTVKLGDFGLAKTERSEPVEGISGTLNYMAPELSLGQPASQQSDMYSLGVTLFELTFGRRPYAVFGTTLREQLDSKRSVEIEFPERWPNSVPERFRGVLERLLERDPADRYKSYEQLEKALVAHAPVGVTNASLLARAFAFGVDYLVMALFVVPFGALAFLVRQGVIDEVFRSSCMLVLAVPLLASLAEYRGMRTLGRYLFQLRIVDPHGLLLTRQKRWLRSLLRNLPMWVWSLDVVAYAFGLDMAMLLIAPLDELLILADMLPVLGRRRQSLHDRVVGSHIVLDTHYGHRRSTL